MGYANWTTDEVREEMKVSLGGSTVDVEIEDKDFDFIVKNACRVYNRYRPRHGKGTVQVSATVRKYKINIPYLQGVTAVSFVENLKTLNPAIIDPFSYIYAPFFGALGSGDTLGEFTQQRLEVMEGRRVLNREVEWQGNWEPDGFYYLYIYCPTTPAYFCSYDFDWSLTPDDDQATGIKFMSDTDTSWFVDFVIAKAKQIVGTKRRKYGGIPNADGGTDSLDGDAMTQEGKAEEAELMEEIKRRRAILPPVFGG